MFKPALLSRLKHSCRHFEKKRKNSILRQVNHSLDDAEERMESPFVKSVRHKATAAASQSCGCGSLRKPLHLAHQRPCESTFPSSY